MGNPQLGCIDFRRNQCAIGVARVARKMSACGARMSQSGGLLLAKDSWMTSLERRKIVPSQRERSCSPELPIDAIPIDERTELLTQPLFDHRAPRD